MKIDITLNRSLTIVPKQYEAIKPNVAITFKDVPIDELGVLNSEFESVLSGVFIIELINQYVTYKNISNTGLDNYCMDIIKNKLDKVAIKIEKAIENIEKIKEGKKENKECQSV